MYSNRVVAEKLFHSLIDYIMKLKAKIKEDYENPLFDDKTDRKIDILDKDFDKINRVRVDGKRRFM